MYLFALVVPPLTSDLTIDLLSWEIR